MSSVSKRRISKGYPGNSLDQGIEIERHIDKHYCCSLDLQVAIQVHSPGKGGQK